MKPYAYYNDNDPSACAWLRELMADDLITQGEINERSITDVKPGDLAEFTRLHFFAGIAGWELALNLAGWPADEPVWSASLPCQPFSLAGARKGKDDERHLLPTSSNLSEGLSPESFLANRFDPDATGEARAMRLRGYGNAIQVDTAVQFIQMVMLMLQQQP